MPQAEAGARRVIRQAGANRPNRGELRSSGWIAGAHRICVGDQQGPQLENLFSRKLHFGGCNVRQRVDKSANPRTITVLYCGRLPQSTDINFVWLTNGL